MDFKIDTNPVPSSIKCIQFSLMSPEEIEKYSVVEVNKAETYSNNVPNMTNQCFEHLVFMFGTRQTNVSNILFVCSEHDKLMFQTSFMFRTLSANFMNFL